MYIGIFIKLPVGHYLFIYDIIIDIVQINVCGYHYDVISLMEVSAAFKKLIKIL